MEAIHATSYVITANEIAPHWYWMKCMATDKYGNKTHYGWNKYGLEVFEAVQPFTLDKYRFYQLNERATAIQDNTGTTGLVSEPQLELIAILRVRIECHR